MASKSGKDVTFGLRLDTDPFNNGLKKAEKATETVGKKITTKFKSIGSKLKSSFAGWGKTLAKSLINPVSATLAGAAIGAGLVKGISTSLKSGFESLQIDKQLKYQLEKVNHGSAFDELKKFSDTFQRAFNIDDNDARKAIIKFAQAGLNPQQIKAYTTLAADISAGTGDSLDTVTEKLSKLAMGIPEGLDDYGVSFKSTGDIIKDTAIAYKQLESIFAGAAGNKASTDPFARFRLSVRDLMKSLGEKLLPTATKVLNAISTMVFAIIDSPLFQKLFNSVNGFFDGLDEKIKTNFGNYQGLLLTVRNWIVTQYNKILPALNVVFSYFDGLFKKIGEGKFISALLEHFENGLKIAVYVAEAYINSLVSIIYKAVLSLFDMIESGIRNEYPLLGKLIKADKWMLKMAGKIVGSDGDKVKEKTVGEIIGENAKEAVEKTTGLLQSSDSYKGTKQFLTPVDLVDTNVADPQAQAAANVYGQKINDYSSASAKEQAAQKQLEEQQKQLEKQRKELEKQRQQNQQKKAQVILKSNMAFRGVQTGYR